MITELKQEISTLQSQRQQYEDMFRMLFKAYEYAVLIGDGWIITDCNATAADLLGYPVDQLIGREVCEFFPQLQHDGTVSSEKHQQLIARVCGGEPQFFEFDYVRADGSQSIAEVSLSSHRIGEGTRMLAICRDISERKASEEKLRISQQRYSRFVHTSPLGVYRTELDRPMPIALPVEQQVQWMLDFARLAECNQAVARLYGVNEPKQFIGRTLGEMFHGWRINQEVKRLLDWIRADYRLDDHVNSIITAGGETRWLSSQCQATIEDGHVLGVWGTEVDITARVQAEQDLRKANEELDRKNVALNELLSQVRNERTKAGQQISENLDRTIKPLLDVLRRRCQPRLQEMIDQIYAALDDIAAPISDQTNAELQRLTPTELRICRMIHRGLSNKEIASMESLAVATINAHRRNIRRKLGLTNRKTNLVCYLGTLLDRP